jgi:hypothetical protein
MNPTNSPADAAVPAAWTLDNTEQFLTRQALPSSFVWPHRDPLADGSDNLQPVLPSYRLHKGYGFWLRTTPYFPGLFEEVHAVLLRWPDDDAMPDADALANILNQRRALRGKQTAMPL